MIYQPYQQFIAIGRIDLDMNFVIVGITHFKVSGRRK
jgi:hypothetical protein